MKKLNTAKVITINSIAMKKVCQILSMPNNDIKPCMNTLNDAGIVLNISFVTLPKVVNADASELASATDALLTSPPTVVEKR